MIKRPPTSYLKKFYFDTIVFTHHQLDYLAGVYGSDHIILGTDYPYDMALPEAVRFVEDAKLTRAAKAAILGGNAARLLGIELPKPAAVAVPRSAGKSQASEARAKP